VKRNKVCDDTREKEGEIMIEIRFHGRGGQGAVVASKIMANSVFLEGKFCQSFPSFGVERRGAPVTAFLRVDDKPLRIRTEIYEPDHIVILDPLLVDQVPVEYKQKFEGFRVATVAASQIAFKHHLGSARYPIVNTAILGAVAKVLDIVDMESLEKAIREDIPANAEDNVNAAKEAYRVVCDYSPVSQ
jgi:2-oxoacid:acceptor oxidoreductase gamma subunit (pyruvate/2-ketoisovalerate family)